MVYKRRRAKEGSFRCEQCGGRWPASFETMQDGLRVCVVTCKRSMSKLEIEQSFAQAAQEVAAIVVEPVTNPVQRWADTSYIRTVSTPATVRVGGTSQQFVVTGGGLASVVFTADAPLVIADAIAEPGDETRILTVAAPGGTTPGDYSLHCSIRTSPLRKSLFKVRN
jgi:hypothetical protein